MIRIVVERYSTVDKDGVPRPHPTNWTTSMEDGKQLLVSTLSLGDVVVMDNLSSHKSVGVRDAIKKAGTARQLPQRRYPHPRSRLPGVKPPTSNWDTALDAFSSDVAP